MAKIEHIQLFWSLICCSFASCLVFVPYGGVGVFIFFKKMEFSIWVHFWGLDYYQGCKIELSWVKEVVFFFFYKKWKSVYFFEIHNFEDKRSLVDIDQLPNISFQFFIKWTQFFLFIGPESDHCLPLSLTHSLTDWLTDSLLFSKLD